MNNEVTREDYARSGRLFIEFFGGRKSLSICREDYFDFARWIGQRKGRNGRRYGAIYVRKIVTQLYQLTNLAVELDYLPKSPAPKMKRLSLPAAPPPRKASLNADEVKRLIDSAPEEWKDFFLCALATGARRGELFSMTYKSVSWEKKTISIVGQMKRNEVRPTKTAAGLRTIALPDVLIERLATRVAESAATEDDLIFPNVLGGQMSYPNFYRRVWIPTVKAAKLEGLHLHDLRKAFASRMVMDGRTPSYLEEVMGHQSFATTMKYYVTPSDEEADRARKDLKSWLCEEASSTCDYSCAA